MEELIVALIVLCLVSLAVYFFIIYVVPWLLLVMGTVGLPAWLLVRLLITQRLQLTRRSAFVLFFVNGLVACLIANAIVEALDVFVGFAVLVGASLFFLGGLLVVVVWAAVRWHSVRAQAVVLIRAEEVAREELKRLRARKAYLEAEIAQLRASCEQREAVRVSLEERLELVCAQEPRVLGAVRSRWCTRVRSAGTDELRQLIEEYEGKEQSPATDVALGLMRLEVILREQGTAERLLRELEGQYGEASSQLEAAAAKAERATKARQRADEASGRFLQGPILL